VFLAGQRSAVLAELATPSPVTPDANGLCGVLPSDGGKIGQGVYAWSRYIYSKTWNTNAGLASPNYTDHLQKLDGTNVAAATFTSTDTQAIQAGVANDYRLGIQNHAADPDNYQWCEYDS